MVVRKNTVMPSVFARLAIWRPVLDGKARLMILMGSPLLLGDGFANNCVKIGDPTSPPDRSTKYAQI
jgi:hypothetical protein